MHFTGVGIRPGVAWRGLQTLGQSDMKIAFIIARKEIM